MARTERQLALLRWLPVAYLFTVAGFHFDGWYHAVVGRNQFWITPHFFVMAGQIAEAMLAYFFWKSIPEEEKRLGRHAKIFFLVQLLFFSGLAFDESWHRIIGEETINTPLVFWGPPHAVIAFSLLASPFFLVHFIRNFFERGEKEILTIFTCSTLFAFIDFYFQPLWPLGAFHVLGVYGETAMLTLLGFILFWAVHNLKNIPLAASIVTLAALSLKEIMSWGALADIPSASSVFGTVTAYPFWLTFFSFFIAAAALDLIQRIIASPEIKGALWGGIQAGLYSIGAKLWVDWSPHSFYPGWKAFPGLELSWQMVFLFTVLGALGGAIGFLLFTLFRSLFKFNKTL